MKFKILFIIGIVIGLAGCQNKNGSDYQSSGKITGPDLRMCICCGGWQIVIDNETYNFDTLTAESGIDLQKETFPVFVKLDWKMRSSSGCLKWIDIQKIKKE
jgi:hypothetical protein